ncbi:hypothetical protein F4779DRAFT_635387 [Xylariaceae sp. FL0662B]|nr:hypothetical protein F4779DRAFT_635387 [Xylariaceae sp. FL0662B]
MASALPPPRDLLTSLINTLTSIPAPAPASSTAGPGPGPGTSAPNPLRLIPATHRLILTTLHVLYPSTLLPALDLLDRRLVTRVRVVDTASTTTTTTTGTPPPAPAPPPGDAATAIEAEACMGTGERTGVREKTGQRLGEGVSNTYYLVHSAQPPSRRRFPATSASISTSASASGRLYVVRPRAWNCSCAAFAFAAFPRDGDERSHKIEGAPPPPRHFSSTGEEKEGEGEGQGQGQGGWEFGGLSADGVDGSGIRGVPCCKHLLACVLAERWGGLLGGYVEERVVGREEGAGLLGDV